MLIYRKVPFTRRLDKFYEEFGAAGADAILIPDVPVREGAPFAAAAEKAGVAPVFIAPARASERTLEGVAKYSKGYIYAVSRDGVTGTEQESQTLDRKSTRLNSSHVAISYAVFCLKKKKSDDTPTLSHTTQ